MKIALVNNHTTSFPVLTLTLDDVDQDDFLTGCGRNCTLPICPRLASRPARMPVVVIIAT